VDGLQTRPVSAAVPALNDVLTWNGAAWTPQAAGGSGWALTGNAGTNPAVNYVGTSDNVNFVIKRNNVARITIFTDYTAMTASGLTPVLDLAASGAGAALIASNNTASAPTIGAGNNAAGGIAIRTGGDIGLAIQPGTSPFVAPQLRIYESAASGTNYTAFQAQAQGADITYTLPANQGSADTFLANDGAGGLAWSSPILARGTFNAVGAGPFTIPSIYSGPGPILITLDNANPVFGYITARNPAVNFTVAVSAPMAGTINWAILA
jgi:hypothetical protein